MTPLIHLISAAVGSLIGGTTNYLAITMLFHPYEQKRLFGIPLPLTPGLVPRNRERLAERIGETVHTHLLSPQDLARALENPDVREALTKRTDILLEEVLSQPLSESIESFSGVTWDSILDMFEKTISTSIRDAASTPAFRQAVSDALDAALQRGRGLRLRDLTGPEASTALSQAVTNAGKAILADTSGRKRIIGAVSRRLDEILDSETPLGDIVGDPVIEALSGWVTDEFVRQAPPLAKRLARSSLAQDWLHESVTRMLSEMGPVLSMLGGVASGKIIRLLNDRIESELERLPEALQDAELQERLGTAIREAITSAAERSPRELLQQIEAGLVIRIKNRGEELLETLLMSPSLGERLAQVAHNFIEERMDTRLDEFLKMIGEDETTVLRDRLADLLCTALSDEKTLARIRKTLRPYLRQVAGNVHPVDLIDEEGRAWLRGVLVERVLHLVESNAPAILEHIDTQAMVRDKVMALEISQLERILRETARKELRWITLLGFILGGIIGAIQPFFLDFLE